MVNNLFAKLFVQEDIVLVMYVILHINLCVMGVEKKYDICDGGNRKEIMCFRG